MPPISIAYRFNSVKKRDVFMDLIQRRGINIVHLGEHSTVSRAIATDSWIPGTMNVKTVETRTIFEVRIEIKNELINSEKGPIDNLAFFLNDKDTHTIGLFFILMAFLGTFIIVYIVSIPIGYISDLISPNFKPDPGGPIGIITSFILFGTPIFIIHKEKERRNLITEKQRLVLEDYFGKGSLFGV